MSMSVQSKQDSSKSCEEENAIVSKENIFCASIFWPSISIQNLNEIILALCEISDSRLPKPYNKIAKENFKTHVPSVEENMSEDNLDFESYGKKLAERFEFDLRSVFANDKFNMTEMKIFANSSVENTSEAAKKLANTFNNYREFAESSWKAIQSCKKSDGNVKIGQDEYLELTKHNVSLLPNQTVVDLYEKLSDVWSEREYDFVFANLKWLFTNLESQRFVFYCTVGQHLMNEYEKYNHVSEKMSGVHSDS